MHIGEAIKQELKQQDHTIEWFAEQLCCTERNAYRIFNKTNIDIALLERICRITNHNFFTDLGKSMDADDIGQMTR